MSIGPGDTVTGGKTGNVYLVLERIKTTPIGYRRCELIQKNNMADSLSIGDIVNISFGLLKKVKTTTKEKEMTTTRGEYIRSTKEIREWSFHVASKQQINLCMISSCLTSKDPVAIIENSNDSGVIVVVLGKFLDKMHHCKGGGKLEKQWLTICGRSYGMSYVTAGRAITVDQADLGELLGLFKKIRVAPYKKRFQCKAKVSVKLARV